MARKAAQMATHSSRCRLCHSAALALARRWAAACERCRDASWNGVWKWKLPSDPWSTHLQCPHRRFVPLSTLLASIALSTGWSAPRRDAPGGRARAGCAGLLLRQALLRRARLLHDRRLFGLRAHTSIIASKGRPQLCCSADSVTGTDSIVACAG